MAGLLTLLEPIMIAFLGVLVGGIVIAMYLPIFDLISKLASGVTHGARRRRCNSRGGLETAWQRGRAAERPERGAREH